jgi:hypothetical protein
MTRNELQKFQGILIARQTEHATEREMAISNTNATGCMKCNPRCAGLTRVLFSLKRLAAVPWSPSCITCQEAADRSPGQPWNAIEEASLLEGSLSHAA